MAYFLTLNDSRGFSLIKAGNQAIMNNHDQFIKKNGFFVLPFSMITD
jgi:hypothetical protein